MIDPLERLVINPKLTSTDLDLAMELNCQLNVITRYKVSRQ